MVGTGDKSGPILVSRHSTRGFVIEAAPAPEGQGIMGLMSGKINKGSPETNKKTSSVWTLSKERVGQRPW